jgi:pimeloyl-ACP methyl ester carboxylesterase
VPAPVRLQTHVWNPLGDRRALLLHGLASDGACWWRLASQLADDGWMVLAPDLRGHGRSPAAIAY